MTGKRIYFTVDDPQGLVIPAFAVRRVGEKPAEAVIRAILAKNEGISLQGADSLAGGPGWIDFARSATGEVLRLEVEISEPPVLMMKPEQDFVTEPISPAEPGAAKADEYEPPAPEQPRKTLLRPSPTGWRSW